MTRARLVLTVLVLLLGTAAQARPGRRRTAAHKHRHARTQERAESRAPAPAALNHAAGAGEAGGEATAGGANPADGANPGAKTLKTKTYTFGAMDVEGKLKTPQLLYFLNRVKLELDMSAPDKRSFMKELNQSADDRSL